MGESSGVPPIRGDERVVALGKTGSGKTYAMGLFVSTLPRLLVIDPKGTLRGKWGLKEESGSLWRKLRGDDPVRMRLPEPDDGDYDRIFYRALDCGPLTVYVDEVYGVMDQAGQHRGLRALYTRGREMGVGTWAASQRPAWIPRYILSESEWIILFRLQEEDDRKRMRGLVTVEQQERLRGHAAYLYNTEWDAPIRVPRFAGRPQARRS